MERLIWKPHIFYTWVEHWKCSGESLDLEYFYFVGRMEGKKAKRLLFTFTRVVCERQEMKITYKLLLRHLQGILGENTTNLVFVCKAVIF